MSLARAAALAAGLLALASAAHAQDAPVASQCVAIAQALPSATYANLTPAEIVFARPQTVQARSDGDVIITYAGHSTYVIETPAGVRIATDYSGHYGSNPLPRLVTMNKAHRTHYTPDPDLGIEHVLHGWNDGGDGPAEHRVVVDDVYVRNVPTDIRRFDMMEKDGNSIFIFEVAGLCIGHLGHLHHDLTNEHYGAIGRLDVVMVPVDGGMTQSLTNMSEITERLYASVILPMHRHSTPMGEFLALMGEGFAVDFRSERSLTLSLRTLPRRPTIIVLEGV